MTTRIALLFALCAAAHADTLTAYPGDFLSDSFTVPETWTIVGGTGTGFILIFGVPPFAFAQASGDPDDADGATAQVTFDTFGITYTSQFPGLNLGAGAAIPFTFDVPFSFDSTVDLYANGGLGVGVAEADYSPGSGIYQVSSESLARVTDGWAFYSTDNPKLASVTLYRDIIPPAPEPCLIWACLAGLVGMSFSKDRRKKK